MEATSSEPGGPAVAVTGEVPRPVRLGQAELERLRDGEAVADFHCREGWSRLGLRWAGVRLSTVLAAAGARAKGRFVTVASGGFSVVLSREEAGDERVLLALERDAIPLRPEEARRLVGPSEWDCFRSVTGVDRIEVTREPAPASAERIALARLARLAR